MEAQLADTVLRNGSRMRIPEYDRYPKSEKDASPSFTQVASPPGHRTLLSGRHVVSKTDRTGHEDLVRLYLEDIGATRSDEDDEARWPDIEPGRRTETSTPSTKGLTRRRSAISEAGPQGEDAQRQFVIQPSAGVRSPSATVGHAVLDLVRRALRHPCGRKFDWRKAQVLDVRQTWWIRRHPGASPTGSYHPAARARGRQPGRLQKERAGLEARLGRRPPLDELAAELDLAPERVKELTALRSGVVETPVGEDGETELATSWRTGAESRTSPGPGPCPGRDREAPRGLDER